MSTLAQMRTKISRLVRDDASILAGSNGDVDLCLGRALQTYSLLRPKCLTQDLTVNSDYQIATSSITGFDRAYIDKLTIEYPVLVTYGPPNYLDRDQWVLYQSPSGLVIRFIFSPQQSQAVRITHGVPHAIPVDNMGANNASGSLTVVASDEDAIAAESAANACEMLSVYYTQSADRANGADFVGFTTKGGEYKKRADMLHRFFTSHMDKSLGMSKGSFQVVRS